MEAEGALTADLPSFANPPLDEVVLGIQFGCQELSAVHVGEFYNSIKDRFPTHQQAPALVPQFESLVGPVPPQAMMMPPLFVPAFQRQWFISLEDDRLIQLQPDRLIVNWRRRPGSAPYPRYGEVKALFVEAMGALDAWLTRSVGTPYVINQCEIGYFNLIPLSDRGDWARPGSWVRLWKDEQDGGEGVSFQTRHLLVDNGTPYARLSTDVFPGQKGETPHLVVNLIARGRSLGDGCAGAITFMDRGREAIVKRFEMITTPQAHAHWKRNS